MIHQKTKRHRNNFLPFTLLILVVFLQLKISNAFGETKVGGPISEETTWTAQRSPYIVTMHTEVTQGATLTVEPGVVVRFDGPYFLKVSGELVARGTELEPIVFTSQNKKDRWLGISFERSSKNAEFPTDRDSTEHYKDGSILEYCEMVGSCQGCVIVCKHYCPIISNCKISNKLGGGIYIKFCNTMIKNSEITHNFGSAITIWHSQVKISHNRICENYLKSIGSGGNSTAGISAYGGYVIIENNEVTKNEAIPRGGSAITISQGSARVVNNLVSENKAIGLLVKIGRGETSLQKYALVQGNSIKGNFVGIYVSGDVDVKYNEINMNTSHGIVTSGEYKTNIYRCNIHDNKGYQMKAMGRTNITATQNWWGTADELAIREVIYDHWDKPDLGKVIIKPFLLAINPKAGVIEPVGPKAFPLFAAASISNVRFSQNGNIVIIRYDLEGHAKRYRISLKCSRDGGKTFDIIPKTVSGDVGNSVKPGKTKKIYWDVLKDFPMGLSGETFMFKVEVK